MEDERIYTISGNYPRIFTIKGAAKLLQVSPRTVRRWINDGDLKASALVYRTFRILENDIIEFIKEKRMLFVENDNVGQNYNQTNL